MRLAVVGSAPRGGLLHYAAQLSEGLAGRGHEVDLITAHDNELSAAPQGVRVRDVLPAEPRTQGTPRTRVGDLVRRAELAVRLARSMLRTLWELTRRRYDVALLVDDLSVVPTAAGALLLTMIPRGPLIAAICHEPRPRSRRGAEIYKRSRPLLAILRRTYPRFDLVFVHGERSRRQFLDYWPPTRVEVIPHGDERMLTGEPPPPSSEERILFFGEWRRAKGLEVLMEAFDGLIDARSEARLTIAGVPTPDVDPARVRAWAAGHGARVELVDGYVPIDAVRPIFGEARVVATPYIAGSQSGVVHLAMTMERAVVASDIGELPEAVVDGVTGRVVPGGDAGALRDALIEVLADPELAHRWGVAGRARVLSEFSWERVAERVESALVAELR